MKFSIFRRSVAKVINLNQASEELASIFEHIEDNLDYTLDKTEELVKQPSISPESVGIEDCAKIVADYFTDFVCDTSEVVETDGNPIVYGEYECGAEKTILGYFMYDTQPYDEELWDQPPMEANLVSMDMPDGEVEALVNRGAFNTKGPMVTFLAALRSIKETKGELPVNLKLIAEGEEELGSPSLPGFVESYNDRLSDCDACFFPFFLQDQKGNVDMYLGNKGLVYFELECSGSSWGRGPEEYDIHGSNKAWMDSPAWRMIGALSSLCEGNDILVDGFYENVDPLTRKEKELVEDLAESFDPEPIKEINKVSKFSIDEENTKELIEAYVGNTTLNIDGIWGGYTGEGSKTVLPYKVTAKLDARLVPNQTQDEILEKIRNHLDKHGYEDIEINVLNEGYGWSRTNLEEDVVQAGVETIRDFDLEPRIWPRLAGTAPFYLFSEELELPFTFGLMGHGGKEHSPNEYIIFRGNEKIAGFNRIQQSFVRFLYRYANR